MSCAHRSACGDSEGKLKESTKKAAAMKKAVPAAVTTTTLPQLVGDKSMRMSLLPLQLVYCAARAQKKS